MKDESCIRDDIQEHLECQRRKARAIRSGPSPQMAQQFIPKGGEGAAGGGKAAAGGGEAAGGAASYIAPALAMAALIYGGEKAGVGVEAQAKEYGRFGKKLDDELFQKLKFWEWF